MIEVSHLTRQFGRTTAVSNVSFSIQSSEVVGLLGPNGAGKTTIMRMLSGFLEPTTGSVTVNGENLGQNAYSIQRQLGYLPENLPIYPEMMVADYMDYVATIKGIEKAERSRAIREALISTEMTHHALDTIGKLSRGQKQRVGVAQAVLGRPRFLILDEPTNGLDPHQTEQMRSLIGQLSRRATIILSTHIMQEVEAICDRVIIINKGVIVANKTIEELRKSKDGKNIITILFNEKVFKNELQAIKNVEEVDEIGTNEFKITSDACHDLRKQLFEFAVAKKFTVLQMSLEENKLEDIFHKLTN